MKVFIRLTESRNSRPVWVNKEYIATIKERRDRKSGDILGSTVWVCDGEMYDVVEMADEVVALATPS